MLLSKFGNSKVDVKKNLFMRYCPHCPVVLYGQPMIIPLLSGVFMLLIMTFLDSCSIYLGIRECLIFLSRSTFKILAATTS